MSFREEYSVFPHGIRCELNSKGVEEYYAAYKMIITVSAINGNISENNLKDAWAKLKQSIDERAWKYRLSFNQQNTLSGVDISSNSDFGKDILFIHRSVKGTIRKDISFRFGEGFIEEVNEMIEYHDAFEPLFNGRISLDWVNPEPIRTTLREMGLDSIDSNDPNPEDRRFGYDQILRQAHDYSRNISEPKLIRHFKEPEWKRNIDYTTGANLMPAYAAILDEPEIAERRFGIVREFLIPVTELTKNSEVESDFGYDITVQQVEESLSLESEANKPIKALLKLKKCNSRLERNNRQDMRIKYYHGLRKLFFNREEFNDNGVRVEYVDPYNRYLNSIDQVSKPHPDGIYILASYKTQRGSNAIKGENDPFNRDFLKGYNVAVKTDDLEEYYSLSLHNKKYNLLGTNSGCYSYKTSGVLTPQGEIHTAIGRFRSNLLLSWKGDNALVNRLPRNRANNNGGELDRLDTISDVETEGFMVSKELFDKEERLVANTQLQLYDRGVPYNFFFRTVSATEHCIPLRCEVDDDFLLTLEDLELEDAALFASASFDVSHTDQVPIKKVDILKSKTNQATDSDGISDGHHMIVREYFNSTFQDDLVFDAIKEAKRSVFPPSIKFEDWRFIGYLSKERLIPDLIFNPSDPGMYFQEFVKRCMELEKRSNIEIPESYYDPIIQEIQHLADPRGHLLAVLPGDLFTLNFLVNRYGDYYLFSKSVFKYYNEYPFFRESKNAILKLERNKDLNRLDLISEDGQADPDPIYEELPDGIFNFRLYCSNGPSDDLESLRQYMFCHTHSFESLRASAISLPPVPKLHTTNPTTAIRLVEQENTWYHSIRLDLNNVNGRENLWKSIKFKESTKTLRLTEDVNIIRKLMSDYSGTEVRLDNEYPYDIFLDSDKDDELRTSIHPSRIDIKLLFSKELMESYQEPNRDVNYLTKVILSIRFNDEDVVRVGVNGNNVYLGLNDKSPRILEHGLNDLIIKVNHLYQYNFYLNNVIIDENENNIKRPWVLEKPINPEISVNSFEMEDKVFKYLLLKPGDNNVDLEISDDYVFIKDEGNPYACDKEITLFGSSIFQAYFPGLESEKEIGTEGSKFNLSITNNTKPTRPELDCDILLHRSSVDKPSESKVENVLRILLPRDFMKEGKNKLGIVLCKVIKVLDKYECVPTSKVSEFGEDLTKLTDVDWSGQCLEDVIQFPDSNMALPLTKYFNKNSKHYYIVDDGVFEVLECTPYYNTQLKKWQVLIAFNLKSTETMFFKISAIKISPGHGVEVSPEDNSWSRPFEDLTKTNWSEISHPIHVPVYGKKEYSAKRLAGDPEQVEISVLSKSKYDNKIYCVLAKVSQSPVLNLMEKNSPDPLSDFEAFSARVNNEEAYSEDQGKVLISKNIDGVHLSLGKGAKSILILEFERHENSTLIIKEPFGLRSDVNPLFDFEGVRLVNMAEIKLEKV